LTLPYTVLIPARLASSRLPNKPLADIAGLPLIVRVAQRMSLAPLTRDQVIVATDSAEVVQACASHGVRSMLTRDNHISGSDRLAEACELLELEDDHVVVNVQGDEPLMDPRLVRSVAELLEQSQQSQMSTAAHPIGLESEFLSPHVVKVVTDAHGQALYFSRAPIAFWRDAGVNFALRPARALRHIGLYAYRAGFLKKFPQLPASPLEQSECLEQLRALWYGFRISVYITEHAPGPGVDTPEDLERVRALFD
jgi:3-deoxy-manno-octulosonate cytidylyltransferase (CMP-KDO synthetase)